MIDKHLYDAIVIGGGPAGLTAAMYLARACYRVLVVEKESFGGQIALTAEVVNYPGAEPQSGRELAEKMRRQAEGFGAEFLLAEVESLDFSQDVKVVKTSRGDFRCFGVLLASGAYPRMVGFKNEAEFRGHGVAYCATCDGEFFTGKEVFVVGGGFAAAEESVFLTRYASHVTVLIRGDGFSCAKETAEETLSHPKITVKTNTEIVAVEGDSLLRSITFRDNKTDKTTTYSPSNGEPLGVFVFAGYKPATDLVRGIAELDPQGYIITPTPTRTSREGLFAAGDVTIKRLRQVVTATGEAATAASEMEYYLSKMRKTTGLEPEMPIRRSPIHQVRDAAPKETAVSSSELLDDEMKHQLQTVFERMESPLILEIHPDDREVSEELKEYMKALADLTEKLTLKELPPAAGEDLPCVRVLRADGTPAGITFHGAPGGHEFTSFVLGLYNAAGPGQTIPEQVRDDIQAISDQVPLTILVSLSCTMCPELVTAAGRIATLTPHVTVDIYDINHFPQLREKYNVMSVPCFFTENKPPEFGKKNIEQLLAWIKK